MVKVIVVILILQAIEDTPIAINITDTSIIKENVEALAQASSGLEVVASLAANNVSLYTRQKIS
ncbi:hypothetical protein MTP04_01580 [Lysinibacillus sp. PLM2]|nr:hypothetical protein MTP04_01580 [Lysinibacillus sp. PLM2]